MHDLSEHLQKLLNNLIILNEGVAYDCCLLLDRKKEENITFINLNVRCLTSLIDGENIQEILKSWLHYNIST